MDEEKFHDRGYKALFSHPRMVKELILSFVKEEFVENIDFSTLTRSFNSFVTEEFREREADIIWQVKVKGSPVYFYLLIEFQSTVDRFMVLRLLSYILLFYLEIIKDEKVRNAGHLPAVFPLLLYSGADQWNAAQTIQELIYVPSGVSSAFIPSFRYYKIAENEWSSESLNEMDSLVSHLFLIETAGVKELAELVGRVVDLLRKEVEPELQQNFGIWLRKLFRKRKMDIDIDIAKMTGQEVRTMLEANLEKYEEQLRMEGRLEGRLEVARMLFDAGHSVESVKKLTRLSDEELENLKS
ncbi:MAG: Rpn family recombination-promoting nuclease/putative transposase [Vulcanimicrobiota bacterium]